MRVTSSIHADAEFGRFPLVNDSPAPGHSIGDSSLSLPVAEEFQSVPHVFGKQRSAQVDQAPQNLTERMLVGDNDPRVMSADCQPFSVKLRKMSNIKRDHSPSLLRGPLQLFLVGQSQTIGFRG
jgi:hypothetical protein